MANETSNVQGKLNDKLLAMEKMQWNGEAEDYWRYILKLKRLFKIKTTIEQKLDALSVTLTPTASDVLSNLLQEEEDTFILKHGAQHPEMLAPAGSERRVLSYDGEHPAEIEYRTPKKDTNSRRARGPSRRKTRRSTSNQEEGAASSDDEAEEDFEISKCLAYRSPWRDNQIVGYFNSPMKFKYSSFDELVGKLFQRLMGGEEQARDTLESKLTEMRLAAPVTGQSFVNHVATFRASLNSLQTFDASIYRLNTPVGDREVTRAFLNSLPPTFKEHYKTFVNTFEEAVAEGHRILAKLVQHGNVSNSKQPTYTVASLQSQVDKEADATVHVIASSLDDAGSDRAFLTVMQDVVKRNLSHIPPERVPVYRKAVQTAVRVSKTGQDCVMAINHILPDEMVKNTRHSTDTTLRFNLTKATRKELKRRRSLLKAAQNIKNTDSSDDDDSADDEEEEEVPPKKRKSGRGRGAAVTALWEEVKNLKRTVANVQEARKRTKFDDVRRCFRCNSTEHIIRDCPDGRSPPKKPEAKPDQQDRTCPRCNEKGHGKWKCPTNPIPQCAKCKKRGHETADCWGVPSKND